MESLGEDLLRGADEIGRFIGLTAKQTFHLLDQGKLPAGKEGKIWIASKTVLREHYRKLVSGN